MNKFLNKALSYLPSPLPVGMTEFNTWADSIIDLSGQFADPDSMKFAISSIIMHLDSTRSFVPKHYFVKCLRKVAANQVAGQVFQDIKTRQQEAALKAQAEAAAKTVEATTPPVEASNVPTTQTPEKA